MRLAGKLPQMITYFRYYNILIFLIIFIPYQYPGNEKIFIFPLLFSWIYVAKGLSPAARNYKWKHFSTLHIIAVSHLYEMRVSHLLLLLPLNAAGAGAESVEFLLNKNSIIKIFKTYKLMETFWLAGLVGAAVLVWFGPASAASQKN